MGGESCKIYKENSEQMRTFICNIVPNNIVTELHAAQAANNFCLSLIGGNCFDECYSIVPVSWFHKDIVDDVDMKYLSGNPNSSRFFKYITFVAANFKCAWLARKSRNVWFYNVCMANIICYILLLFVFRRKCNVILLDYTPSEKKTSLQHYIPYFMSKAHGIIALSQRMFFFHRNITYKAGVISKEKIREVISSSPKKKLTFLFSGNLGNHTGFPMALEVFKEMPQCQLLISGHGNVDIESLSSFHNIQYLGYMEYDEYLKMYEKVDVCLSFRNPAYPENEYNFPSKILEYFCYGKFVLSTIEYPELKGFMYLHCDYDKESVKQKIEEIINMDIDAYNKYRDNRQSLMEAFSVDSWKQAFLTIEHDGNG